MNTLDPQAHKPNIHWYVNNYNNSVFGWKTSSIPKCMSQLYAMTRASSMSLIPVVSLWSRCLLGSILNISRLSRWVIPDFVDVKILPCPLEVEEFSLDRTSVDVWNNMILLLQQLQMGDVMYFSAVDHCNVDQKDWNWAQTTWNFVFRFLKKWTIPGTFFKLRPRFHLLAHLCKCYHHYEHISWIPVSRQAETVYINSINVL